MYQKIIQLFLAFYIIKDHAIQKLLKFKLFSVLIWLSFLSIFSTSLRFTYPFRLTFPRVVLLLTVN
jgi:hypothetical protein